METKRIILALTPRELENLKSPKIIWMENKKVVLGERKIATPSINNSIKKSNINTYFSLSIQHRQKYYWYRSLISSVINWKNQKNVLIIDVIENSVSQ